MMSKKQKQYLWARVANIRGMIKDDPERHPAAIIATTGGTFYDDLTALYQYCVEEKQEDICKVLLEHTKVAQDFEKIIK